MDYVMGVKMKAPFRVVFCNSSPFLFFERKGGNFASSAFASACSFEVHKSWSHSHLVGIEIHWDFNIKYKKGAKWKYAIKNGIWLLAGDIFQRHRWPIILVPFLWRNCRSDSSWPKIFFCQGDFEIHQAEKRFFEDKANQTQQKLNKNKNAKESSLAK